MKREVDVKTRIGQGIILLWMVISLVLTACAPKENEEKPKIQKDVYIKMPDETVLFLEDVELTLGGDHYRWIRAKDGTEYCVAYENFVLIEYEVD